MRPNAMHDVVIASFGVCLLALSGCRPPVGAGPVAGRPEPAAAPVDSGPAGHPKGEGERRRPELEAAGTVGPYARLSYAEVPRVLSGLMAERGDLLEALERSLDWFAKPSSRESFPIGGVSHARAWASVAAFRQLVAEVRDPQALERRIISEFDFYQSLGHDGRGGVLFTGYYAPVFEGARERDAFHRFPLHKLPTDLVVESGSGAVLGRRVGGRVVPYPTRAEIEDSGLLNGSELVWLSDPFEAYLIHVQGSASIRLSDGSIMRVGYAGNNGHDYVSVSRQLLADGKLGADEISLDEVRGYFAAHPSELGPYLRRNPRYVFFREMGATDWPTGSLGVKLTPLRSLASDKELFPPGGVVFVATRAPDGEGKMHWFEQFMLDQDSGGAIRSPGRADIYYGVGPEAERRAGGQYADGRLYFLFLKPDRLQYWTDKVLPTNRSPANR